MKLCHFIFTIWWTALVRPCQGQLFFVTASVLFFCLVHLFLLVLFSAAVKCTQHKMYRLVTDKGFLKHAPILAELITFPCDEG